MPRPLRRSILPLAAVLLVLSLAVAAADSPPDPVDPAAALVLDETALLEEGGVCPVMEPLQMAPGGPLPPPNYCDDCRPCTERYQCGIQGGHYLGWCSPNPSYCYYPGYSACVCL